MHLVMVFELKQFYLYLREKGLHKRTGPIVSAPPITASNKNKREKKGKKKDSNYGTQHKE